MKKIPTNYQDILYIKQELDKTPLNGEYVVEIKKLDKKRTTDQNALYWAFISHISYEITGSDKDKNYYHHFFKDKFLLRLVKSSRGKTLTTTLSTTRLSKKEFKEYLENIKNFMAEYNIELPTVLGRQYDQFCEMHGI
ncbi:MAG: recombination protein NinB [Saprospiraceae bacterium]